MYRRCKVPPRRSVGWPLGDVGDPNERVQLCQCGQKNEPEGSELDISNDLHKHTIFGQFIYSAVEYGSCHVRVASWKQHVVQVFNSGTDPSKYRSSKLPDQFGDATPEHREPFPPLGDSMLILVTLI